MTATSHRSGRRQVARPTATHGALMVALEQRVIPRTIAAFHALWVAGLVVTFGGRGLTSHVPTFAWWAASVVAVWAGLVVLPALGGRRIPGWVALVDACVFVALLLAEGHLVPAGVVGDATTWVVTGSTVAILTAGWLLPAWQSSSVTTAIVIAYLAGLYICGHAPHGDEVVTAAVLAAQGGLAVTILGLIRAAVVRADVAVARRDSTERAASLQQQRDRALKEQDRMLHDHVSTSLWLLGRGLLPEEAARGRAADAVAALRRLAAGTAAEASDATFSQRIREVVAEARRAGLEVDLTFPPDVAIRKWPFRRRERRPEAGWLPRVVVDAVCAATREALTNVIKHAGSRRAHVIVSHGPSQATVMVSDQGAGFTLGHGEKLSRGVRRSIVERMDEVGGTGVLVTATAADSPEQHGTTWTLSWNGAAVFDQGPGALSRAAFVEYARGFVRVFAAVAVVFHLLGLVTLTGGSRDYRSYPVAAICWAVVALVGAVVYLGIGKHRVPPSWAWAAAVTIIVTGAALAADCLPRSSIGYANWSLGDAGWFLALLAAYLPVRKVAASQAIAALSNAAVVAALDRLDADAVQKLVGILVGVGTLQVGGAIAFGLMRAAVSVTVTNMSAASELITARLADDELRLHREQTFREIDADIVNLLEGIADGHLDPHDPQVLSRCLQGRDIMRQYAALRQAGAADLAPVAAAAVRSGIDLRFPVLHRFERLTPHHRTATVRALMAVLDLAKPGTAIVTVQENADLTGSVRPSGIQDAATPLSTTIRVNLDAGAGQELRRKIETREPMHGLHVDLELVGDDGDPDDVNATLAWLAVVCWI